MQFQLDETRDKEQAADTQLLTRAREMTIDAIRNGKEQWPDVKTFNKLMEKNLGLLALDTVSLKREYTSKSKLGAVTRDVVKELNETLPVELIATGGISSLQDVKHMGGNLGVGLQFRLSSFKAKRNGWIDPHFLYVMFNAKTATSSDTGVLQREILFPEISKRDFVIGYFFRQMKNDFCLDFTVEAALNKYTDSIHTFRTESMTLGFAVSKAFAINLDNVSTSISVKLFPYYNLINIDPKYWADYDAMLKSSNNAHATFHTLGLQTFLQADNIILFCNAKYVLNKMGETATPNRDFVRFVYTIGTMVAL